MEKLIKEQLADKSIIEATIKDCLSESSDTKTKEYFTEVLRDMQEQWADIKARHRKMLITSYSEKGFEEAKYPYFDKNIFSDIKKNYYTNYGLIEKKMKDNFPEVSEYADQTSITIRETPTAIHLPKITLEKFNGDYRKWPSFHDLFRTLVHENSSLAPVQKLQYLKMHIVGEPENLLRQFQITDTNYQSAWQLLRDRYNNKRILVGTQLSFFFGQPSLTQESAQGIKNLLDTTTECLQALENLSIITNHWDPVIIYTIVQRLPSETHQMWEQNISNTTDLPTWKQLQIFLETRFRTLEAIASKSNNFVYDRRISPSINSNKFKSNIRNVHLATNPACLICGGSHKIRQCSKFASLSPTKRFEKAKAKGLCINCLRSGHTVKNCPSSTNCFNCQQRHHTLLHRDPLAAQSHAQENKNTKQTFYQDINTHVEQSYNPQATMSPSAASFTPHDKASSATTNVHTCATNTYNVQVLLATAQIKITSPVTGEEKVVRALIDPGSETSFITESTAQCLNLKKIKVTAKIQGIGQNHLGTSSAQVNFILTSLINGYAIKAKGLILGKLTNLLPTEIITTSKWPHLEGLELADPEFFKPGKIDVLLGADLYAQILQEGLKRGAKGSPLAQNTIFGWVLTGEIRATNPAVSISNFHININLENELKKFWEIEEIISTKRLTEEEQACEDHFKKTHKRLDDGTYQVELPFHENRYTTLGKSRSMAISRLYSMEHRFIKDQNLQKEYSKCLQEYIQLGHMEKVHTTEENYRETSASSENYLCCYLPHHSVIKESSTTTKLRVVFDASRATSNGTSLNNKMMKGPVIQDDLATHLLRWRKYKVAFTADLEKMYRQIKISSRHSEFQRIVWRESINSNIEDYKLKTVTFGTRSAPYLATRVLKQLALDEKTQYPIASEKTLHSFYVDDLISGADTIEAALEIQSQLIALMKAGGFSLRKWSSNNEKILEAVPESDREMTIPLNIKEDETIKTLGLHWNPSTDKFSYTINIVQELSQKWTKRTILSEISKLFDPLGLLSPFIILAKIFIQHLWLLGLNWDEEVNPKLKTEWLKYRNSMKEIENIQISRWSSYTKNAQSIELHGFCDASIRAYAASIYLCITDENGVRHATLLISKTKVSPIKTISLPRLELCGAALLAKLFNYVLESLKLPIEPIKKAWTDSEIVLAWLKGHPSKWTTFVANRVSDIHQKLGQNIWAHVPSAENPADCASRGLYPNELIQHKLWWHGPEWLLKSPNNWPKVKDIKDIATELRKIKTFHQTVSLPNSVQNFNFDFLENRYSSFTRLVRITSYIRRFIFNCSRQKQKNAYKYLTAQELKETLHFIIKIIQTRNFKQELYLLQQNKPINNNSKLIKLNPFIDNDGLLRVGGRLRFSNISYNEKHPIILPDEGKFIQLLITKIHKESLHGGFQLMSNIISRSYWLINSRNLIRHFIHKCNICFRVKTKAQSQLMGNLPAVRVNYNRPFSHSGVDYCGPFEIKTYKAKNSKRYKAYISVFICMVVKAIHLELVTDLTAEGFIAAYRRFSSRRGRVEQLYCDNGTNFVSANKILKKENLQMLHQLDIKIAEKFENEGVTFNFIPPGSPHFGGLWEADVKSTKQHLKRVLGNTILTYEEFSTVLTQIEACLNSRPLCPINSNSEDLNSLTPAHFLVGDVLMTPPEPTLLDININRLNRWQHLQNLYQTFWKRWRTEYLCRLQQRPKWVIKNENIKQNDLVILKEENLPPSRWALGRIIETHPGSDGLVRVVTLKTKSGILKRPITKICLLPTQ